MNLYTKRLNKNCRTSILLNSPSHFISKYTCKRKSTNSKEKMLFKDDS